MNSTQTSLIIPKSLRRQIQILNILFQSNYSLNTQELAHNLDCTEKTLLSDIRYLQEILPSPISITIDRYKLIDFHTSDNHIFYETITEMAKTSPLYQIIKGIFQNNLIDLESWADYLFLSDKTIKRYLLNLKSVLKNFNLRLSMHPINLLGKEEDIRLFFFHLFSSSDLGIVKPEKIFYELSQELVNELGKQLPILKTQQKRSIFWALIILTRIENKQFIQTSVNDVRKPEYFSFYKEVHKKVLRKYGYDVDTIPDIEFVFADRMALDSVLYYDAATKLKFSREELPESNFEIVREILDKNFDINPEQHRVSYLTHLYFFANIRTLSQFTPLFQKNTFEVNLLIKKNHPEIFAKWISIFKGLNPEWLTFIQHTEDVCVRLTMITTLFLPTRKSYRSVLILLTGDTIFVDYIRRFLAEGIDSNISLTYIYDNNISNLQVDNDKFDLIITNNSAEFPFSTTKTPIYSISMFPNESEVSHIQQLLK